LGRQQSNGIDVLKLCCCHFQSQKFLDLEFETVLKDPWQISDPDRVESRRFSEERIGAVSVLVFENALQEPRYSTAYAKLVS